MNSVPGVDISMMMVMIFPSPELPERSHGDTRARGLASRAKHSATERIDGRMVNVSADRTAEAAEMAL